MRKLLRTTAATLITLTTSVGVTLAQTSPPALAPSILEGVPATPLPVQGANNANNGNVQPQPNGIANPTPGSIVVHLNARVLFGAASEWSSLDTFRATPTTAPQKVANFGTLGFARIYPGVDGMAANGLRYGASVEIRKDFGPTTGSTTTSGGSANSFNSTLFVRRAFVYFANDRFGIVRLGQGDGVISLFDQGITTF